MEVYYSEIKVISVFTSRRFLNPFKELSPPLDALGGPNAAINGSANDTMVQLIGHNFYCRIRRRRRDEEEKRKRQHVGFVRRDRTVIDEPAFRIWRVVDPPV